MARIVVCYTVHCKNLVCSNERIRSEREGQGGGGTNARLFSANMSPLYQLTVSTSEEM